MKTKTRPARVTPKIKFLMIDLGTRRWVVVPITDDSSSSTTATRPGGKSNSG